jgi:hypothetical protein
LRTGVKAAEEQQHDPPHPRGIFHQVGRLESLRDHVQHDAAPRLKDEEDEENEGDEDRADEPPVVREPDED